MALHQTGMPCDIGLVFFEFEYLAIDFCENIDDGLVGTAPDPLKKRIPGLNIQFYRGNAGTVLTAIMLLFHE
jgi:hypothetical protein